MSIRHFLLKVKKQLCRTLQLLHRLYLSKLLLNHINLRLEDYRLKSAARVLINQTTARSLHYSLARDIKVLCLVVLTYAFTIKSNCMLSIDNNYYRVYQEPMKKPYGFFMASCVQMILILHCRQDFSVISN